MIDLTAAQRQALRARAHRLHPVVIIGEAGLTPAVLNEIDGSLKSHELIKIRVLGEDRGQRRGWLDAICRSLDAAPVQQVGKLLIVYRPRPEEVQAPVTARKPRKKEKRRAKRSYQMQ
ncbi:MAG: hypothetical protein K0R53_1568 [Burkholderiales bacterium]|jgi:putative YhbY family RNA-binding protein|nr:hypothetical protein [Burkholderiales bacterium]